MVIKLFTGGKSWQLSFISKDEAGPEVEAKPRRKSQGK